MEILWKHRAFEEFTKTFHTKTLGKITVIYAVSCVTISFSDC